MRKTGWLPDPFDVRDRPAAPLLRALPAPPPSASLRHLIPSVLDQGALGSCVANAILQAIRAAHVRQGYMDPQLGSRLFGYYLSRAVHHQTGEDSGTYLRTFFQILNRFGFCPEAAWPYTDDDETFKRMPPSDAFRRAIDQVSPTIYRRIDSTGTARVDDVKRAVAAGYVVAFGTDVSVQFASNDLGAGPIEPPVNLSIAGGHALCVTGYDHDSFLICNSWGSSWGAGGFCHFAADYIAWPGTRDLWIVERAPGYSE